MTPDEELQALLEKLEKDIRALRMSFLRVDDFERTMRILAARPFPFVDREGLNSYAIERLRKGIDAVAAAHEAFQELEL